MNQALADDGIPSSATLDRFQALLDVLPAAVYATDAQGIVTFANQAATELAGRPVEIGNDKWSIWRLFYPDGSSVPLDDCPMAQAIKQRRPIRGVELIAERPDGTRVPILPYPTPVFDKAGRMTGAVNLIIDVSATKRSIAFAQRRLAAIVEFSDDAIIGKDLHGVLTDWNAGAQRLFGYTAAEVIGKPVTVLFPPDHLDEEPGILARIQRGEAVEHYETVRLRKDGTRIDVSLTVSPIKDEDGRIIGASKIIRDVTARKRSEEALARRVNELGATYELIDGLHRAQSLDDMHTAAMHAIFRGLPCDRASILLFDDAGVMRFVAAQGLSAAYRSAVEGHSPWTPDSLNAIPIIEPNIDAADMPEDLRATIKREGIAALAFIPLVAGGKVVGKFMIYYNSPHEFAGGEMALAVSIANQFSFGVTRWRADEARRRAEEELRINEERERERAAELQAIMEAAPVSIWITRDPDCTLITGNRTANEFLRLPPDVPSHLAVTPGEWNEDFDMFVDDEPMSLAQSPIQRAARGEEVRNAEGEIRFKDGTSRVLLGNATPLRDKEGAPYGAVATFVDITQRKQMEEALRAREAELEIIVNRTPFMLTRCTRDLRYGIVSQAYARLTGRAPEELVGKPIVAILGQTGMRTIRPYIDRVLEGNRVEFEEEVHFEGIGTRFLHAVYTPERDERGGVTGWIASILDVTERKRAEMQRDLLVAELSHRVKNTLATVVSIARQSFAKNPNVEDARRSFDARILALAQTHTRLAESSWSGVLFETLLLDEFEPYRRDDGGNVHLSGPTIALSPVCILTLGMAIHELATNAAKYGALSTKEGVVDVVWDMDLRDRLRIRWAERGGPPVQQPKRVGFGRQLLERATAAGLRGGVDLNFAPAGLTCTITIPTSGNVMGVLG